MDQIELKVGVKALLQNSQGKYLLIKRNIQKYPDIQGVWDIPGGRIKAGISYLENLKREIYEETRLNLSQHPKLIAAQDILRVAGKHVVRLTFIASISGDPILDNSENTEFRWLSFSELKNNIFNLDIDAYLKEVIDNNLENQAEISAGQISPTTNDPEIPLGKYQHFKGSICQVIGIARHSETKEKFVVYQHFDNSPEFGPNALWIRPKEMFLEKVEIPRFKYLDQKD